MTYRVFRRMPWRRARGGGFEPNPCARCYTIRRGLTLDEARALCAQGPANQARDAGREYRNLTFYEYTQE